MKKIVDMLLAVLKGIVRFLLARKNVAIRFILTLFFIVVLFIPVFSILVLTVVQFVVLLLFVKHVDAIKSLSHRLTVYTYQILRYLSLNENKKPFPLGSLPDELEPPEETDLTNPLPQDKDVMNPDENLASAEEGGGEPDTKTGKPAEEKNRETIILDYKEGEEKK